MPAVMMGQRDIWLSYGEVRAAQGRWDDVFAAVKRLSTPPGVEDGDISKLPYVAMLAASAYAATGRPAEAERLLRATAARLVGEPPPRAAWNVNAALGELLLTAGRHEEARAFFKAALRHVDRIAEDVAGTPLHAGFLSSPQIERLRTLDAEAAGRQ